MRTRFLICAAAASLWLAIPSPARANGVLPAAATPVQREQAQARFLKGKELLGKKQYEQALAEFTASHEIVASPNARLEIARCLRGMGKVVAAYAELGRTAVEAKELLGQDPRYLRASEAATAEREEMERQLGFVTLTIQNPSEGTTVVVGAEEVRRAAWGEPTPIVTGATDVVVQTPGHGPVRRTVSLTPGQKTSLVIDAQSGDVAGGAAAAEAPPAAPVETASKTSPLRIGAYAAGGVGVVGLLVFTVGGVMAHSTYNDLNNTCHGGPCPTSKDGEISSGKSQQTIANVGLAFGLVGVAAGATLFVLSLKSEGAKPESPAAPPPSAALVVAPGWVGVRGGW